MYGTYSMNILMFKLKKNSIQHFLKQRACHCVIGMNEERGTELNELQRLKPTHELLHFALLHLKHNKRLLFLSVKNLVILTTSS